MRFAQARHDGTAGVAQAAGAAEQQCLGQVQHVHQAPGATQQRRLVRRCRHQSADEDERPDLEEPDRWLRISEEGSHDRWNDRYDVAERLRPGPLRDGLLGALEGRGAFGRFSRALDREPALLPEWRAFPAEREVGRARAALASDGYLALPS